MAKQITEAWIERLGLRDRLLIHLGSAQSRWESAIVSRFRAKWPERHIRMMLRALQKEQLIELDDGDRVRWRLTAAGRSAAKVVRDAGKRRAAA